MTGNEAIAEGAIKAGCRFYAGYPITPQNELIGYMSKHMVKAGGVFIQAESELGAINMVFGAAATGERAMTSSSSPGMSLKQEGISYISGAELPAVIVNMMRGGPGLGNIAPAQSDYFQATKGGGHGDYHPIVLAPASVQECFDFVHLAFDLADKYRNPVIILADGMLGQMMEPLKIKNPKSKIQKYKKPWALTGCFKRSPNTVKSFCLHEGDLEKLNILLQKKFTLIDKKEQRFEGINEFDADIILVAYGTMARVARDVINDLKKEGIKIGLIRPVTLWPFPKEVFKRIAEGKKRKTFLVTEMSYGQMVEDVKLALNGKADIEFIGRGGGGIPSEEDIIKIIKERIN
ncbi:3-methyl-2-oxobutanoate dehydrogenase subunit VorB [bacterium]|nr:MAG: 3-methyl-2-oxobutanoate dehydrogenase subunit VorB [bacterium]